MMPESPQWPTKIFPRLMKQMEAVVPAVEASPDAVGRQLGRSFTISCEAGSHAHICIVHQSVTVLVARSYLLHGEEALADGAQHSLVVVFAPEALREVRIQILSFSKPKSALNCLNRMG